MHQAAEGILLQGHKQFSVQVRVAYTGVPDLFQRVRVLLVPGAQARHAPLRPARLPVLLHCWEKDMTGPRVSGLVLPHRWSPGSVAHHALRADASSTARFDVRKAREARVCSAASRTPRSSTAQNKPCSNTVQFQARQKEKDKSSLAKCRP